jgi:hypothetical protein
MERRHTLHISLRSGRNFGPQKFVASFEEKSDPYSTSGRLGKGNNVLTLPRVEPQFNGYPSRSEVAVPL